MVAMTDEVVFFAHTASHADLGRRRGGDSANENTPHAPGPRLMQPLVFLIPISLKPHVVTCDLVGARRNNERSKVGNLLPAYIDFCMQRSQVN